MTVFHQHVQFLQQIYDNCGYQEKILMRVNYKTSENHVTILELKKLEIFEISSWKPGGIATSSIFISVYL